MDGLSAENDGIDALVLLAHGRSSSPDVWRALCRAIPPMCTRSCVLFALRACQHRGECPRNVFAFLVSFARTTGAESGVALEVLAGLVRHGRLEERAVLPLFVERRNCETARAFFSYLLATTTNVAHYAQACRVVLSSSWDDEMLPSRISAAAIRLMACVSSKRDALEYVAATCLLTLRAMGLIADDIFAALASVCAAWNGTADVVVLRLSEMSLTVHECRVQRLFTALAPHLGKHGASVAFGTAVCSTPGVDQDECCRALLAAGNVRHTNWHRSSGKVMGAISRALTLSTLAWSSRIVSDIFASGAFIVPYLFFDRRPLSETVATLHGLLRIDAVIGTMWSEARHHEFVRNKFQQTTRTFLLCMQRLDARTDSTSSAAKRVRVDGVGVWLPHDVWPLVVAQLCAVEHEPEFDVLED